MGVVLGADHLAIAKPGGDYGHWHTGHGEARGIGVVQDVEFMAGAIDAFLQASSSGRV